MNVPHEIETRKLAEDILIEVYVPEMDDAGYSRSEALKLAQERDLEAAQQLAADAMEFQQAAMV